MSFQCERSDYQVMPHKVQTDGIESAKGADLYLKPDRLVVVDDEIRRIAKGITSGKTNTFDKGRAIYDYVVEKMTYDKNHPGWGSGSTRHACEVGKGNCTDFHALFNSLARAEEIPSGFEIGLYLPYEKSNSNQALGSYHCWAFFKIPGKTWIPVDCSEANRFPEKKEFFFGGHTANRVTFSTGRDLVLSPKQSGAPLNFFIDPYAEANGKPVKTSKAWSFKELEK